jgi:hypothetical protein
MICRAGPPWTGDPNANYKGTVMRLGFSSRAMFASSAIAVVAGLMSASVFAQSASTFQDSCENIRYGVDKRGMPIALANCLKADGQTPNETAVALRGFHNNEGRLTAGAGASSFQQSCQEIQVNVRDGHVRIDASCQKSSGEWVSTSTILYDVHNNDGQLQHKVRGNDEVAL